MTFKIEGKCQVELNLPNLLYSRHAGTEKIHVSTCILYSKYTYTPPTLEAGRVPATTRVQNRPENG
jgi:hypothetical protein